MPRMRRNDQTSPGDVQLIINTPVREVSLNPSSLCYPSLFLINTPVLPQGLCLQSLCIGAQYISQTFATASQENCKTFRDCRRKHNTSLHLYLSPNLKTFQERWVPQTKQTSTLPFQLRTISINFPCTPYNILTLPNP